MHAIGHAAPMSPFNLLNIKSTANNDKAQQYNAQKA
jgi:hypothetical protein